ncbi:MAG: TetR/AcrR family transcriptional regulator [Clostridium butyricum]|nr:TetR/AcrR family transcriptional regulator [Clostridium butyricum]
MRITKSLEERKQEILDTAMEIFCEKGYDKTSISDIAQKMGVAQGLCYRYFKSKEEIFDSAIEYYADMQTAEMKKVLLDRSTSLKEKFNKGLNFMDFEKDNNNYYRVFHGKDSRKIHNQLSIKICENMCPVISTLLKEEADRGNVDLKGSDPETVASFSVYGQIGIISRDDLTKEEKENSIIKFLKTLFFSITMQ